MIRIQRQCNGNQIWRKHGIGKKDYGIEGQAGSAAALAAIYVKKIRVCFHASYVILLLLQCAGLLNNEKIFWQMATGVCSNSYNAAVE